MRGLELLFLEISCLMSFLAMPTVAKKKCGGFTFPYLTPEMSVRVAEQSTISIPVILDNFEYPECKKDTVYIYVWQEKAKREVCIARLTHDQCVFLLSHGCGCMDGIVGIVFNKTVTREDTGIWVWRTSTVDGKLKKEVKVEVEVEVSYPPTVTQLLFNAIDTSHNTSTRISAAQNTTLQVTCKWEKGHPDLTHPSKVQLLNGQGSPLNIVRSGDTWIRAELLARCEDAGNITCVVPGASENATAQLIVLNCSTSGGFFETVEVEAVASIAAIVIAVMGVVVVVCVRKRRGQSRASVPGSPNDVTTPSRRRIASTTGRQNDYDVVGNLTTPDYDVLYRAPAAVDEDGYLIVMASQRDTTDDDYSIVV